MEPYLKKGCGSVLVKDVLQRLDQGERMKEIAQSVDLNPSTIQRKLKKLGYVWDNSAKVWNWTGEGDPPLDVNLSEMIQRRDTKTDNNNVVKMEPVNDHAADNKNDHAAAINNVDVFDRILGTKNKEKKKLQRGIYFDPRVAEVLDETFKNKSKGAKSEFVNEAVKQVLKAKNLL